MALRTSLVAQPHLYMGDTTGRPLDAGKVYFGQVNKDPEFYPINIFYDKKLTIVAPQPVLTKGGFMYANGDMMEIYAAESRYSVKVLDKYGRQVFYKPDMQSGLDVSNELNSVADLGSLTDALDGNMVFVKGLQGGTFVYDSSKSAINDGGLVVNGWVRQLQTPYVTPEMYGCIGDGIADDTVGMGYFAEADYKYKVARGRYYLTSNAVFTINHSDTIIDFEGSTIVGTAFSYSALTLKLTANIEKLTLITGNYDGEGVVNNYIDGLSVGTSHCKVISVVSKGAIKNLSNSKNDRSTSGIRLAISCDEITVDNPNVTDVHNINGVSGTSSASGVFISRFRKTGIINNPIIYGVYSDAGTDADGLVLFEEKDVATTGTALAIVNNPDLRQTCGRGIKSQCDLKVRGLVVHLEPPTKGIILGAGWRGVDAQLGNLDIDGGDYYLAEECFRPTSQPTLTSAYGTINGNQKIHNIRIFGKSAIRYVFMLTTNTCRTVSIKNITAVDPQTNLNVFYPINVGVTELIELVGITGKYRPSSSSLVLDSGLTGECENLYVRDVVSFYYGINVTKFNKINIMSATNTVSGVINYEDINKDSRFYYSTDGSTGGINYDTTQTIPGWAKRYCYYKEGDVWSSLANNVLTTSSSGTFYKSNFPAATVIP